MKLFTKEIRDRLINNGRAQAPLKGISREIDFVPVVKLFSPVGAATWLLTEIDPDNPDIAFGLCDLGMGFPETGDVSIRELESVRRPLPLERDLYFKAEHPLSVYTTAAVKAGRIVTDRASLEAAARDLQE